ncbi:DUF998 domain-containing protein [Mycobacterium deserti]|uniref:DUF998 domain-containing protein n=1 Tax=Mycobacterium deserti TaxID=2978347 RepID=A0ABT2MDN8_9MYCO|nr:DUF998 domain-containing protein [Mycobacterium deserti]MCT7660374.1 DUF998 domain-containing protein [Mycobacterium deserti]
MATIETTRRASAWVGPAAWLVGGIGYLIIEAVAAAAVEPSYSYANAYISALGVPAWSPLAHLMNAGFVMQGLLYFVGAYLAVRVSGRRAVVFLVLAAANTVGNLLVATVHGGSPLAEGDGMRWHTAGAFLVFLCGNAAIIAGSSVVARAAGVRWWYRAVSLLIALTAFAAVVIMANYAVWPIAPLGAVERTAVYSIIGWQLLSAAVLLSARHGRSRQIC